MKYWYICHFLIGLLSLTLNFEISLHILHPSPWCWIWDLQNIFSVICLFIFHSVKHLNFAVIQFINHEIVLYLALSCPSGCDTVCSFAKGYHLGKLSKWYTGSLCILSFTHVNYLKIKSLKKKISVCKYKFNFKWIPVHLILRSHSSRHPGEKPGSHPLLPLFHPFLSPAYFKSTHPLSLCMYYCPFQAFVIYNWYY